MPEERDPNIHVIMITELELPGGTKLSNGQKLELKWVRGGGQTLDTDKFVSEEAFIRDPEHMKKVRDLVYGDEVDDMPLTVLSVEAQDIIDLVFMTDDSGMTIVCPTGRTFQMFPGERYLIEGNVRSWSGGALCINVSLVRNPDGSLPPMRRR